GAEGAHRVFPFARARRIDPPFTCRDRSRRGRAARAARSVRGHRVGGAGGRCASAAQKTRAPRGSEPRTGRRDQAARDAPSRRRRAVRSSAVASEPAAENAALEILEQEGTAAEALIAGFLAAAAVRPGVLWSPVQILTAGPGTFARAFDGRARQPGLGLPRPR